MQFKYGATELNFSQGASYPAERPFELTQVIDRTAAGTLQVEDLGVDIERRVLSWELMPKADYDALLDWFVNVAQGAKNVFSFTDEYGRVGDVRIISPIFDFRETSWERYRGELILEYA